MLLDAASKANPRYLQPELLIRSLSSGQQRNRPHLRTQVFQLDAAAVVADESLQSSSIRIIISIII